jgi:hypothetical protein
MSSVQLAFSSEGVRTLSSLGVGERGVVRTVLVRIDKASGAGRSIERANRSKAAVEETVRAQVSPEHMENHS